MTAKRLFCLLLAAALLLGTCPAALAESPAYRGTAYSTDYLTWSQRDPAWRDARLGDLCDLDASGCLLTTMAILMCHSGVYDPATFNPGVLRDFLEQAGVVSHAGVKADDGNIDLDALTPSLLPRFSFAGFETAAGFRAVCDLAGKLMGEGYAVAAMVRSGHHYVAVTQALTGDCIISDPYYGHTRLSDWQGTVVGLVLFRPDPAGADAIGCYEDDAVRAFRAGSGSCADCYVLAADTELYYSPAPGCTSGETLAAGDYFECVAQGPAADGSLWLKTRSGSYLPAQGAEAVDTRLDGWAMPDHSLSADDRDEGVFWVQTALARLGYGLTPDGVFGEDTDRAVQAFQARHGLTVDGVVGPITRMALVRALNAPEPEPLSVPEPVYRSAGDTEPIYGVDLDAAALWFGDLDTQAWYARDVAWLWSLGGFANVALNGGRLEAGTPESRANIAQMLYNLWQALGGSAFRYPDSPFTDVPMTDPRWQAIAWAKGCGLVDGYGGGLFGPEDPVTRQQLCKIMAGFAAYADTHLPAGDVNVFTDAGSIQVWALPGVASCAGAGLVNGYPDGSFRPENSITRAEVCTILMRLYRLVAL